MLLTKTVSDGITLSIRNKKGHTIFGGVGNGNDTEMSRPHEQSLHTKEAIGMNIFRFNIYCEFYRNMKKKTF